MAMLYEVLEPFTQLTTPIAVVNNRQCFHRMIQAVEQALQQIKAIENWNPQQGQRSGRQRRLERCKALPEEL